MIDKVAVSSFIAKHIAKSAKGAVDEQQLAKSIDEVELESQIEGSSFIKVHIIDPYWKLATSGFLEVSEQGLLDKVQCEFPEDSGLWWQLVAIELSNETTQPNLTLVFEDRIVAWLREQRGEKLAPAGATTRAQFVKALLDEVGLKDRSKKITPVIPSLSVLQPVEAKKVTAQEIVTEEATQGQKATEHAQVNKTPGLGAGAAVTVKGQKLSKHQQEEVNALLAVANAKGANQVATEALIFAAIAESSLGDESGAYVPNSAGYYGVLQGNANTWPDPHDTKGMAEAFLDGGKGFQAGGAIHLSRTRHDPVEIAVRVEAPSIWPENAYAKENGYENFLPEAQAILKAGGGIVGGSGNTSGESDVKQLQRGSTNNPDEDSFECIQRLARQVRWFAFTDGQRFFYMDGFDFERQKPSAYIDIPASKIQNGHSGKKESGAILTGLIANFDNTTFEYFATHKKHGRGQRKSAIARPQTPSEIRVSLLCEPLEYRAGDVFVIQSSGPLNGRWVVTDAVRNYIEDPFTTFTLEPPQAPYPEPRASSISATSGIGGENPEGPINSVVEAAKKALSEKSKYQYSEASNRENNGTLFGSSPRTMDCSSFAILCYKAAKQPDPSGANFSPIGNTNTLISHMVKTDKPQPGDLCFFGTLQATTHVNVYIGNGKSISMGAPGDPSEGLSEQMGPSGFLGYWRPAS